MKKFLSLPALGVVLAITFAFTPKLSDSWKLFNGQTVSGTAEQIKDTYCPGANLQDCAIQINGSQVIKRP